MHGVGSEALVRGRSREGRKAGVRQQEGAEAQAHQRGSQPKGWHDTHPGAHKTPPKDTSRPRLSFFVTSYKKYFRSRKCIYIIVYQWLDLPSVISVKEIELL